MNDFERKDRRKFNRWRQKAKRRLPEISQRVFDLRGVGYTGCGFHWSLEKTLGYVINRLNDYDEGWHKELIERISIQVIFSGLFKDVAKIEKEISHAKTTTTKTRI